LRSDQCSNCLVHNGRDALHKRMHEQPQPRKYPERMLPCSAHQNQSSFPLPSGKLQVKIVNATRGDRISDGRITGRRRTRRLLRERSSRRRPRAAQVPRPPVRSRPSRLRRARGEDRSTSGRCRQPLEPPAPWPMPRRGSDGRDLVVVFIFHFTASHFLEIQNALRPNFAEISASVPRG